MRDEKGRFMKGSEGFTGRHSEESKKLMSKSHKGHIAWNKGKTKKEFPQLSNSGAKKGIHCRNGFKKGSHGHLGFKHSEESKQNMSLSLMGQKRSEKTRIKMSNSLKRAYQEGKRSNWKGWITPFNRMLRASSMWKIWREAVFLRDNFTCQNPECEYCHNKIGVMLHPHHIKPFAEFPELRFVVSNGITYCAEFHLNSKLLHKGISKGEIQCQA